jgi:Fic family protein
MSKPYLWQEADFPHFYHNPAVSRVLEEKFQEEVSKLDQMLHTQEVGFDDVFTEEIVANSEIEGVILDRESVHSSFVSNLTPVHEKEQGAVALTQMALAHCDRELSHDLLLSMHREIMKGANVPAESIGNYVGDMKIVSGHRLDQEYTVVHEGVSKELVHEKMTEFIEWYHQCPADTPLTNAVQGHVHFETIHPFCDGNGRIGRSLILMGLCRDLGRNTPLALSRAFNKDLKTYYAQFQAGLDLTSTLQSMNPLFLNAVKETGLLLELTAFRTKFFDQSEDLNPRQVKVLNRLIDYELKGGFDGGMSNTKYQKMTGIGDRTALRDLAELQELGLMVKTGQLKGTRYHLNVPHLTIDL